MAASTVALLLAGALGTVCAGEKGVPMELRTDAFSHEGIIPRRFADAGPSPAFTWSRVPAGTQAFAFIVDDPDAPGGTWIHWVLYDIPGTDRKSVV